MTDIAAFQDPRLSALRERIGWICQTIRALVIFFAVADLLVILIFWADSGKVERHFRELLQIDVSGASQGQYAAAMALSLVVWVFTAVICFCLWRVFSLYLQGGVFSAEAALWLRRAGVIGLVTIVLDVAMRSAVILAIASHLPAEQNHHGYIRLEDLLNVIFLLMLIAIAHIFKTAAEIAGENAQFV
ncbi:DUF2975 domain-containing protein [Methylosinus sp. H3A]|uniref:DUF2975 domain-containing protein n=1 Tax=Methylosinus sp. H3A TaxID=2785786 RepID=UPI0018C24FC4|nr:DUF2975 domain-containing protein [Methylosinus sp. H3A]MBG0809756.1 DUF2975 domain-containing protein [Methylosinus sp. H3A]